MEESKLNWRLWESFKLKVILQDFPYREITDSSLEDIVDWSSKAKDVFWVSLWWDSGKKKKKLKEKDACKWIEVQSVGSDCVLVSTNFLLRTLETAMAFSIHIKVPIPVPGSFTFAFVPMREIVHSSSCNDHSMSLSGVWMWVALLFLRSTVACLCLLLNKSSSPARQIAFQVHFF